MPTTKQRRETARRRLERQIQRRQEAALKRRRRNLITAASLGVVVVLGGVFLLVTQLGEDNTTPAAQSTPTASASATPARAPKSTSGPCKYAETTQSLANPHAKDVGLPPDPAKTPSTGTVPVGITTDRGAMTLTLDRSAAPCAVQSFLYLTEKKFFDNSPCPRVVDQGIFVLQCGDPSGTTGGGPTYSFKEENTAKAKYGPGVVAMANSGTPGSTSSQFFIIYKDSDKALGKSYSVIGTITKGLDVVTKVAAGGNDGSNQAGGGKPKLPITIKTVAVVK
ncbi:MAG TPA: peptidylprolyl isomerase [Mycobacteriales bacterium]